MLNICELKIDEVGIRIEFIAEQRKDKDILINIFKAFIKDLNIEEFPYFRIEINKPQILSYDLKKQEYLFQEKHL